VFGPNEGRFTIRESWEAGDEAANVGRITTTMPDGLVVHTDGVLREEALPRGGGGHSGRILDLHQRKIVVVGLVAPVEPHVGGSERAAQLATLLEAELLGVEAGGCLDVPHREYEMVDGRA